MQSEKQLATVASVSSPGQFVIDELIRVRNQNAALRSLLIEYRDGHGNRLTGTMNPLGIKTDCIFSGTIEGLQQAVCRCYLCLKVLQHLGEP